MSNVIGVKITGDSAQLQTALQGAGREVTSFGKKAEEAKGPLDSLANGFKSAFVGSSVAVGLIGLKNTMGELTGAMVTAQVQVDMLRNGLNFAVGRDKSAGEMDFIRTSAKTLGLEFASTGSQYTKLAAASRGTSLEGQRTRDIFTAVAQASAVMGLGAEQSEGAFLALTQMISKGKVQAEELRGQLGERLPGAFQIASRAMGVTTAELDKMLETGQVLAEDFLPKFAAQLSKEVAPEVNAAAASMRASINNLATSWVEFKQATAQSGVSAIIASEAQGISNYLTVLTEAMTRAKDSGAGLAGQLSSGLGTALARMPFDAAAGAANLLNGSINFLSGGFIDLRTNVNLLPAAFNTNAQSAAALGGKLAAAETDLARLQRQMSLTPDSIYLKSETYQAFLLVQQLRAAKDAQDRLSKSTPESAIQAGMRANGEARTAWTAQNAIDKASLDKIRNKQSGVPDTYVKEMAEIIRLNQAGILTGKEYTAVLAQQQALLTKKTGGGGGGASRAKVADESAKGVALYNDLLAKSGGFTGDYAEQLQSLSVAAGRGALSVEQVARAVALINAQQPGALAMVKAEEAAVEAAFKTIEANDKITNSYLDAKASAQAYIDTITRQNAREVSGMGRGTKYRAEQAGISAIEDKQTTQRQALDGDLRNNKIDRAQYDQYLGVVNETYTQEVALYRQRTADMTRLQADWSVGASEAMTNYMVDAQDVASKVGGAMSSAFKGMEDALVTFITTGKLSFTDMANGIVADITRIIIQQQIMAPLMASMGLGGGGGGAGGFVSGIVGSLFGAPPGRANGGPVSRGALYEVNERGPEVLNVGSRQFLMMGNQGGTVTPNSAPAAAGNSMSVTNHFTISGPVDRRTQMQISAAAASGAQRAMHRNN